MGILTSLGTSEGTEYVHKKCLLGERMDTVASQFIPDAALGRIHFRLVLSKLCNPLEGQEANRGLPAGRLFSAFLCVSETLGVTGSRKGNIPRCAVTGKGPSGEHGGPPAREVTPLQGSPSTGLLLQGRYLLKSRNVISWEGETQAGLCLFTLKPSRVFRWGRRGRPSCGNHVIAL